MILRKIDILHFKNIAQASLTFSAKLNCFVGHNGEGKTNLLDAVCYLSFCRSAFGLLDSQVIGHGEDFFVVEGEYTTAEGDTEHVYAGMKRGQKKQFRRNKKAYKRLSEHIGLVPLVFVSPSDIQLIDSLSEHRRRFLDVIIAQYDRQYIEHLNAYNKALQQRNALLKQEEEPDEALIDVLEQQMGAHGEQVFSRRQALVDELEPVFQQFYQALSRDHEQVSLRFVSHAQRGPLYEIIRRDRMKDRIVGYSLHGIHRDDLEMNLGGYPIKREGSQGQAKSFVVALKLAQFQLLCSKGREKPLLLLDDIFDKLDADRVAQIVKIVSGPQFGQIFITDTNRSHLDQLLREGSSDYKLFTVEGGEIKETDDATHV